MTNREAGSEGTAEEVSYRCPFCEAEYPTEMLARVHVSYADDAVHEGKDGMTPEVEPIECDASGERVGPAFTLAGQLNLHGLSLSDIPAAYDDRAFDERERRALLVAAFNANRDLSETELQDRVTAHLADQNLEPLGVRDLRELCEHVFHPEVDGRRTANGGHEPGEEASADITTAETALRDLTALQQAIIVGHLARPDSGRTEIATEIGTARSYPTQVINARTDLVARLRSRLDEMGLERLVAERIPGEDLEEIREEGYLEAVEVDLEAVEERKRRRNDPVGAVPVDAADDQSTEGRAGTAATGDDAVPGDAAPGDAAPGERDTDDDGEATATNPADGIATDSERDPDGDTDRDDSTAAGERDSETVPRAEVEAVREQVAFDLAVVEQEMELADPTPQQVRTKAYLQQILERLDDILP